MKRKFYIRYLSVTLGILCLNSVGRADDTKPTEASVIQEFDVAKGGEQILLPVTLKEQDYQFVLDTGSEVTGFDIKLRDHLGGIVQAAKLQTPNGVVRTEIHRAPKATIGKIKLQTSGHVICTDLSGGRHASGKEIYGVVGMDFLQHHVIRIDFDRGKLQFLK